MPRPVCKFVFTLNNPTEEERASLLALDVEYLIIGDEVGESGTPHLQGFVLFKSPISFKKCKELLGTRAHLETARALHSAIDYCKKDGKFVEVGVCPERSRHVAKHNVAELVSTYTQHGIKRARESDPVGWVRYGRNIRYNNCGPKFERGEITAMWIYGEPGCGKSRWAYEKYPEAYRKMPQTKWWDGYDEEDEVIFDDLCPGGVSIANCLRWVDRYPCLIENKGGCMSLKATTFVFTSNMTPRNVWPDEDQVHIDAFHRRVKVMHYSEIGNQLNP